MSDFSYFAYGISISSDIELSMLLSSEPNSMPALNIRRSEVDSKGIESPQQSALHYQSKPGALWLNVPNVARFLVLNGSTIEYQPYPNANTDALLMQLTSSCMSAALHQQGMIVLNACAVVINQKLVVFAGRSCEGKSLLAAALHQKGHQVLTDGLCVIDQNQQLHSAYPALAIWRDCFKVLSIKPDSLTRIRPELEKYYYPIDDNFNITSQSVDAFYLLHNHNKEQPLVESLNGMNKIMPLRSHVYRLQYLQGLGLMPSLSKKLMSLANKSPVIRLIRPQKFKVAKWVELIENDVATQLVTGDNKE